MSPQAALLEADVLYPAGLRDLLFCRPLILCAALERRHPSGMDAQPAVAVGAVRDAAVRFLAPEPAPDRNLAFEGPARPGASAPLPAQAVCPVVPGVVAVALEMPTPWAGEAILPADVTIEDALCRARK